MSFCYILNQKSLIRNLANLETNGKLLKYEYGDWSFHMIIHSYLNETSQRCSIEDTEEDDWWRQWLNQGKFIFHTFLPARAQFFHVYTELTIK